jgi:integrase
VKLTDLNVQHLRPPPKGQKTYFDDALRGFGLRLSQGGTKTFVVLTGKERKLTTLGRYPELSLRDARIAAKGIQAVQANQAQEPRIPTFGEATALFEKSMKGRVKPATLDQYLYYLRVLDPGKRLHEITKADLTTKLMVFDGKPAAQNYGFVSLRTFLNWCLREELIDKHPLTRAQPPNKLKSRERVLTDEELCAIWHTPLKASAFPSIVKVLMLTGLRRMELMRAEVLCDTLRVEDTKNGTTHALPLTPLVAEHLRLPYRFNDWSRAKHRFDKKCSIAHWTVHDLRRTLATNLARLGVGEHIIERILNHTVPGVRGVYNRWRYLPEMREALLTYEAHILTIVSPRASTLSHAHGSSMESSHEDTEQERATSQDNDLDTAHHEA